MSARKVQYWVIPPASNGSFAAAMEEVLETYKKSFDPRFPVVCMDEQPIQLLDDVRKPTAETKNHPKRMDYEYKRCGTASIFMFCEPLTGWCQAHVREHRTKKDWAEEIDSILKFFPQAQRMTLVCDNLNTHVFGSFYDTFNASKARKLSTFINLCHTPVHGSWLNIAECELSLLTRQTLLHRRFPDLRTLRVALAAWTATRNATPHPVNWQFTTSDARVKLNSIYPNL